jgi:dihydrolipoamide dehydrogenase
MQELKTKVLVIGGGPGGYVTAIRAGQLGLDTILVEERKVGGTCLNVGCIPSKALIHAADAFHRAAEQQHSSPFGLKTTGVSLDFAQTIAWKGSIVKRLNDGVGALLSRQKVQIIAGHADLQDGKTSVVEADEGPIRIHAEHLVIATGSRPVEIAALPFGRNVISSTEALALDSVPQTLAVVGAGYIGLELGTAYAKLGAKVTVVEATDRILPAWDGELTRPVLRRLQDLGVTVLTGTTAEGLSEDRNSLLVRAKSGEALSIAADKVLVAVGRKPNVDGSGLPGLALDMAGGFIGIDDRCATSMRNVWAVGDVTGEPMLAHRAMAQGEMVAEIIAGHRRRFEPVAIPAICFTDPEIVAVGLLPDQARQAGFDVRVGKFPFTANGRAMTQSDDGGFVRTVSRADNGLIVGIQAVGFEISELSASFSLALEMGACAEDIAATIQAHPSRGEALQESALNGLGRALHI